MHDVGILNDDGSLGSSAAWTHPPPVLLAPALVGKEAPVRFEDTGAWKPLGNTRKKKKKGTQIVPAQNDSPCHLEGGCPPNKTRAGIPDLGHPRDVRYKHENAYHEHPDAQVRSVPN